MLSVVDFIYFYHLVMTYSVLYLYACSLIISISLLSIVSPSRDTGENTNYFAI